MITKSDFKKIYTQHQEVLKMIDSMAGVISYDSPLFDKPLILFDYCMESLFDDEALDIFYSNPDASSEELWEAMKDGRL